MPTWLITGCSTGLGRHLAQAVLERGWNAVVTARDVLRVQDLADTYPTTALPIALDVSDRAQVADTLRRAEASFGRIDVLVNNAGHGYRAAGEEGEDAEVDELFATNFFGPVAMIKAVLPGMRARHHRQHLLHRRPWLPAGIRVLLGNEVRARGHVGRTAQRGQSAWHQGSRRRTWRIPNRLLRPFPPAVRDRDRRLQRHGRAPPKGERHDPRSPTGRPSPRCPGHHHGR